MTTSTASITVAIGTNASGSTLGGTTTTSAVAGVATFGNLTLNKSGVGYTLGASASGVSAAASAPFTVNPGVATALAITTAPTTAVNGVALSPSAGRRAWWTRTATRCRRNGVQVTAALASGSGVLRRYAHGEHLERRGFVLEPGV